MQRFKVTLKGISKVTDPQGIDMIDESGPEIGLDEFLGFILPQSPHQESPRILGAKGNMLAVKWVYRHSPKDGWVKRVFFHKIEGLI